MMPHGKSLLMGAVGTVPGRLGWAGEILRELHNEYDLLIKESGWLAPAPFSTIHYVVRFGSEATDKVHISRISKKYDELPVASQMSMQELHDVFLDKDQLRIFLEKEVRRSLNAVGERYNLRPFPTALGANNSFKPNPLRGSAQFER